MKTCFLCKQGSKRKLHSDGFFYHGSSRCTRYRHRPSKAEIEEATQRGHNQKVGRGRRSLVEVWDQSWLPSVECNGVKFRGRYVIGVIWASCGPVTPKQAREFARNVLKAADIAEKRIARCRVKGWERGRLSQ